MRKLTAVSLAACLLAPCAYADDVAKPGAPPNWYLDEIATLTAGSGRWETDNTEYQGEQEPYEAYVTEWVSGFDGTVMRGRLFGLVDGKPSVDFWEFRLYWHPQGKHVVMEQFGWGNVFGIGTSWLEDGKTKADQMFYSADGSAKRTGHISHFPDAKTHVTASFNIDGDTWTPQRNYTWHLVGD